MKDPTKKALDWLLLYMKSENIAHEVTTQYSERFINTLELAIRFGKILIVNECNEISPPLFAAINCNIQSRSNKKFLPVGNKLVDLHDHFRIILCTGDTVNNGQFDEDKGVYGPFVTIVPFTTTAIGLTDQLMAKSIHIKQPDLEKKRIDLLQKESEMVVMRQELQEKLLNELSSSQGDILTNEVNILLYDFVFS